MKILEALASDPAGIQVTLYPNRTTIDLGYGDRNRFEGETVYETAQLAAATLLSLKTPQVVINALEQL